MPATPAPAAPAGPRFVGGVLIDDTPPPVPEGSSDGEPLKPKKAAKSKSPIVWILLLLLVLILAGGGSFYLYQSKQNEIGRLEIEKASLNTQITALNRRLEEAEIEVQAASDQPIYIDPAGVFSLYRRFGDLELTEENGILSGVSGTATDGFTFTATSGPLNGQTLSTVVDERMAAAPIGVLAYDKRAEMLSAYPGFSYVYQDEGSDMQSIYYFFTMSDRSTSYFEFVYTVTATTEESFLRSEDLMMRVLGSVKLYQ